MSTINILEAYFQQKEERKQKKKIRVKVCLSCIHSSRFDSNGNEVLDKRIYCRAWGSVVYLGSARYCELFEPYHAPQKRRKKSKRRW